jgi:hypothetical protein
MTGFTALHPDDQRSRLFGWGAALVLVALAGLAFFALGDVGVYTFVIPVASAFVGFAIYNVNRPLYLGFLLWTWFLAPFVRRVVDYGVGTYTESSLIIATPYFVGLVGIVGLLRVLTEEQRGVRQAFWLAMVAMIYGAALGLVVNGPSAMVIGALDWGAPIVLAALLIVDWKQYPRYREVVLRTLVVAMGVLGLYGIYQFLFLPPWDKMWMDSIDMTSIGRAVPGGFRAFGTLNSPLPFGLALLVGLLGLFAVRGQGLLWSVMATLSAVPALVALLLTQSRTAWGAAVVGLLYIMIRAHGRSRRAIVVYLLLATAASAPILLFQPVAQEVGVRMESLGSLEDDGSAEARMSHYQGAIPLILTYPTGGGFGSLGRGGRIGGGVIGGSTLDSGVLSIFFTLGWFGTLIYLLALGLLGLWAWRAASRDPGGDRFPVVATSIAVAILSASPLGNTFAEVGGVYMWGFLALGIAGARYHHWVSAHASASAESPPAPPPA